MQPKSVSKGKESVKKEEEELDEEERKKLEEEQRKKSKSFVLVCLARSGVRRIPKRDEEPHQ